MLQYQVVTVLVQVAIRFPSVRIFVRRIVWGRNDTIPGGPPRVANEHEDSGYPFG
jgi:hypothetical protein